MKSFSDYTVASISEEDIVSITTLENNLKEKENKEIILVAFQPNNLNRQSSSVVDNNKAKA